MALSLFNWQRREALAKAKRRGGRRGWDFHSHLLPGVDDGVADLNEAFAAIVGLRAAGFSGAVLTPHVYHGIHDNAAASLRSAFADFSRALHDAGEDFPLHLAAEYLADEHFLDLIRRDELLFLPVGQEKWVLLEFPYYEDNQFAGLCMSALAVRGYRPVVAHVERYRFVARAPNTWFRRFERAGAILQGDIGSLVGQYGESVQRFGRGLLVKNLVPLWGTDLHRVGQIDDFVTPGLRYLDGYQGSNQLLEPLARLEPALA